MNAKGTNDGNLRVGVNLLKQLSSTFYLNTRMIFDELLSNARDAFATKVDITISEDQIAVRDNGEGMDHNEMVKFFYISHTERETAKLKKKGSIKRYIIGKFGIGKLAMHQVCDWFEITSWKEGYESSATFSFKDIEKKTFLDEVMLKVDTRKTSKRGSGTIVTMHVLKKKITPSQLADGLGKSMPLDSDFKVFINGTRLKSERRRRGQSYKINEKNAVVEDNAGNKVELGPINGYILYTEKNIRKHSGVHVRVFGRRVNDNPRIVDLAVLTSGRQFRDRTYCELEVNSLNDALLSSRSGFIHDNPKYQAFLNWVTRLLNKYNIKAREHYRQTRESLQKEAVIISVAPRLQQALSRAFTEKSKLVASLSGIGAPQTKMPPESTGVEFKAMGRKFLLNTAPLGEKSDECVVSRQAGKVNIIINVSHPFYTEAAKGAAGRGNEYKMLEYHYFKAAAIAIALSMAKTVKEARDIYNKFSADILQKRLEEVLSP